MMMHAIRALLETSGGGPSLSGAHLAGHGRRSWERFVQKITEQLAKDSAAVFVLEPSQGIDGAVKTWRKVWAATP